MTNTKTVMGETIVTHKSLHIIYWPDRAKYRAPYIAVDHTGSWFVSRDNPTSADMYPVDLDQYNRPAMERIGQTLTAKVTYELVATTTKKES